ncbi:MAG: DUF3240 family protein [Methylomonas sp.]|nr:DUF3240 family protein [Methylomonas sp.]PPD21663.1 MAG: hypothetical protein CTY23_04640 [Methylomonas sp.]PPD25956.1 MAG: hypothetical protein CTY22_06815 [Methylomonas sp.]PPD37692.1 MAG: hypothetical protein CTY21_06815 [Methylomonas sp.]PPD39299.1 MAG: hypothetical protein CTY17_08260 [Methylomonas sp.]
MNIFLRRIPVNTQHSDIAEFVAPVLKSGFFRRGHVVDVEIMALRDIRFGSLEFHGLVTLDSEWSVQRAVTSLKNRRLNGRVVVVRPYHHRSWYNDPRQNRQPVEPSIIEKRKADRRRGHYLEAIKNVSDRFNSENDFFNTVNQQQFFATFIVPSTLDVLVADCFVRFEQQVSQTTDNPNDRVITRYLLEHESAEAGNRCFQIYARKQDIVALVDSLRNEFAGRGIRYWFTPVVDNGEI